MSTDMGDDERQVQITFKTGLGDDLRVSSAPLVVPARLSRQGLSEVINHLLDLSKKQPFDFLVAGTLLRSSLASLLSKKGLSLEEVIEVEYFLISDEPSEGPQTPHKDWVSAVCDGHNGHIISGCYDNTVRVLQGKGGDVELRGHSQPVTCVASADKHVCVSGSLDHSVRVWGLGSESAGVVGCVKLLGHEAGVASVSVRGDKIVSAAADKTLKLWALPSSDELMTAGPSKGHAKKAAKGDADAQPAKTRGCLATFIAHTQHVTGCAWGNDGQVWSGSWDHSVRCWDVETQQDIVTLSGGHAVSALGVSEGVGEGGRHRLVASGHTDRVVRVWDDRAASAALVSYALHSHKGWVTAVAWSGRSEWELATASLDTTVKLWDIRASVPQHTIKAHEGKVLCVAFCKNAAGNLMLVSGGEDGKLKTFGL